MNNYMILHYGFIPPSPEDMDGWNKWFQSIADIKVQQGGFHSGGKEITKSGTTDLPFSRDSITGYTMIKAESLDEAEKIASECPIVDSTRVYEVATM